MISKRSLPPSITPGVPKLDRFPSSWRRIPFGELLERVSRPVRLIPDAHYQLVVARRNRGGIEPRERLRGDEIKTPSQFEIRSGDFVIAKRQIIHGGCGFVPTSLDGAIVSGEYDVFRSRRPLVAAYLRWFTHTVYFQQTCYQCSIGVDVEKMIFQTDRWLRVLMPLPPVDVQLRIARCLDAIEAVDARFESLSESKRRLKRALLQQLLTGKLRARSHRTAWRSAKLGDLGEFVRGVSYDAETDMRSAADSDAVALLRAGNLQGGELRLDDVYFIDPRRCSPRQLLAPGDVAICMSNGSRALVGKASQIRSQLDRPTTVGAFCTIFRPSPGVDHEFIRQVFAGSKYRAWIARALAGSAINNLRASVIESLEVDIPISRDEERFVGNTLGLLDTELALLDRQLAAVRKLRRGLMQKLLTGELEVPAATQPQVQGEQHAWTAK